MSKASINTHGSVLPWGEGALVAALGWLTFVCFALHFGPDISVDALHYHFYLGKNAWGQGMSRDFLAAGLQSYLTPYAYVPLSWIQSQQWSIGTALIFIASLQSLIVPALWLLACAVLGASPDWKSLAWRVAAILAGLCSPVLLAQVGSTFIDLGTSIPVVLAGALCAFASNARRPVIFLLAAGGLLGLASALKWTQAPIAVAMVMSGALACARSDDAMASAKRQVFAWATRVMIISVGLGLVFCGVMAHWSLLMWSEFGNPIFPMANAWFKSPDFGSFSFVHHRFVPDSLIIWLTKPFVMLDIYSYVHTEIRSPDAKPLLFCIALVALAICKLRLINSSSCQAACSARHPSFGWTLAFVGMAWCVWLSWSGNGRYAIALFAVMGVSLVAIIARLKSMMSVGGFQLLVLISMLLQMAALASADYRWTVSRGWKASDPFIKGSLPLELQKSPATFVTTNGLTHSHLAFSAHPESRWIGLLGSASIRPQGPGFARAQKMLAQSSRIYLVMRASVPAGDLVQSKVERSSENMARAASGVIEPYGLQADASQVCLFAETHTLKFEIESTKIRRGFWYCPVRYSEALATESKAKRESAQDQKIERAMDAAELLCPRFLKPGKTMPSIHGADQRFRNYPPTDAALIYQAGFLRMETYGNFQAVKIGTVDDLLRGKVSAPEACSLSVNPGKLPWNRWKEDSLAK